MSLGPPVCKSSPPRQILGDLSEGDPPVPIPNTEVKPLSPDCTARASVWESRTLPGYVKSLSRKAGAFVLCAEHVRPKTGSEAYGVHQGQVSTAPVPQ